MNLKTRIYQFFEEPNTRAAYAVQALIFACIIASVATLGIEYSYPDFYSNYRTIFVWSEYLIVGIFTLEYLLRLFAAPKRLPFIAKPLNLVDFIAVAPAYLEFFLPLIPNLAGIRIVRILRFMRLLRLLKLVRFGHVTRRVTQYKQTILQSITPVISFFVALKLILIFLESQGYWLANNGLGELFAIIGFALGIILSQKIGSTYQKFIQVEETLTKLAASLNSLAHIFSRSKAKQELRICYSWCRAFLKIFNDPISRNQEIYRYNALLYKAIKDLETEPAELAMLYNEICCDASFCLSKKLRLTPKAYDTLLHQATVLYLLLIVLFIPGFAGLVSVFVATYILYGMYNLTQDLDSVIGGEFDLINVDTSDLKFVSKEKLNNKNNRFINNVI